MAKDVGPLRCRVTHRLADDLEAGRAFFASPVKCRASLAAFVSERFGTVLPGLAQVALNGLDLTPAVPRGSIDPQGYTQIGTHEVTPASL
ncbi:hypothetical protein D9M71_827260 [compost metagenome]